MIHTDVLIVGGGPAGAACAGRLKQAGVGCLILDQAQFPRFKPCAGWTTPQIFQDLGIRPEEYPHGLVTYRHFRVSLGGVKFKLRTLQYAIRRIEFDQWLLERADVEVRQHTVRQIQLEGGQHIIDDQYSAEYLIGAGGTHCPVKKNLFPADAKKQGTLIVAMEEEFPYPLTDEQCYLWFFENHLPGYAWYVPKANGYVNVGIGGSASQLKANGNTLKGHWQQLLEKLEKMGLIRDHAYEPAGHSYHLRQSRPQLRIGNAFLVGDAVGLATLDMGEGIHPAIRSGILAAEAIINGQEYSVASIPRFSWPSLFGLRR